MNRVSVILVSTVATLSLTAAAWRAERPLSAHETHVRSEAVRLRAHFDQVDVELRTRDVSNLSASQRANRARLIAWLRDYRDAGVFPLNDKFAGEAVPFFRDSKGTLCAMAYLIDRSGRADIVSHVASTRNNAYIRELVDDRNLVRWLDTWGLTAAEAARIQPMYEGGPCCPFPDPAVSNSNKVDAHYALLSTGLGGSSIGTLGFNLFSPSRTSGAAGVLAGTAAIVAGVTHANDLGDRRIARANVVAGSLALLGGLRGLLRQHDTRAQAPTSPSKQTLVSETRFTPDLILSPDETRVGLRMQARF
jgi:hypothetical protein